MFFRLLLTFLVGVAIAPAEAKNLCPSGDPDWNADIRRQYTTAHWVGEDTARCVVGGPRGTEYRCGRITIEVPRYGSHAWALSKSGDWISFSRINSEDVEGTKYVPKKNMVIERKVSIQTYGRNDYPKQWQVRTVYDWMAPCTVIDF